MRRVGFAFTLLVFLFCVESVQGVSYWKACNTIPDLNQTCVTLNYSSYKGQTFLNINLDINSQDYLNKTLLVGNLQHTVCVDQNDLISLMNATSSLSSYSGQVNAAIAEYGYIPKDEYSLCVSLQDVSESSGQVTGCTNVDATLMCFDTGCSYKGIVSYGCWIMD
mmetsp:Transcript_124968/g.186640  ORF Transcript_124968/g.186640 Transcript_124968/m.186640 type:complete len:165 (-) Transcript_124968:26-520(-)